LKHPSEQTNFRDRPRDYPNGDYHHPECTKCGLSFSGQKHTVICRECVGNIVLDLEVIAELPQCPKCGGARGSLGIARGGFPCYCPTPSPEPVQFHRVQPGECIDCTNHKQYISMLRECVLEAARVFQGDVEDESDPAFRFWVLAQEDCGIDPQNLPRRME
jgi:NAD-dependent SIR2 family protein deacetylase